MQTFGGLIYVTKLPKTLEITFINKNMMKKQVLPSSLNYPVKGLDYPYATTLKKIYRLNSNLKECLCHF